MPQQQREIQFGTYIENQAGSQTTVHNYFSPPENQNSKNLGPNKSIRWGDDEWSDLTAAMRRDGFIEVGPYVRELTSICNAYTLSEIKLLKVHRALIRFVLYNKNLIVKLFHAVRNTA